MDSNETPRTTRRQVLTSAFNKAKEVAAARVSLPFLARQVFPPLSEEQQRQYGQKEIVDGVEVYGRTNLIKTDSDLTWVIRSIDTDAEKEILKICEERGLSIPQDRDERRKLLLDKDKRYLQVTVAKSVYDRFADQAQMGGLSAPAWFKAHVDLMNKMHQASSETLITELKRVLILDDHPLSSNFHRNTGYTPRHLHPVDIDGWWEQWTDLRGIYDNQFRRQEASAYTEVIDRPDRKGSMTVDYGLIHEWYHALYNLPDEYVQGVTNSPGVPELRLVGDGLSEGVTTYNQQTRNAFSRFDIQRIKQLNIRGYLTDPLGHGRVGYSASKDSPYGIFGQVPKNITIDFIDAEGKPLTGVVNVKKAQNDSDYYSPKKFEPVERVALAQGGLKPNQEWFSPQTIQSGNIYPTNFFINLDTTYGPYGLHLPVSGFNLSSMAGVEDAVYKIQFHQNPTSLNLKQYIELVDDGQKLKTDKKPLASMRIAGTDTTMKWFTD